MEQQPLQPEGEPTPPPRPVRGRVRALARAIAILAVVCVLVLPMAADLFISAATSHDIADRVDAVEPTPVALILGTARTHRGQPNQFYRARIEAAAELFHSGRVRGILVSGDNATIYYNEPQAMRKDLIALGVPDEFITLDYAGFRTLDSVVRAKRVFGQDHIVVVSQRFHVERAVFLAQHYGIHATGLAAPDPTTQSTTLVRTREVFARVAALLDVLTRRGPRFLGAPETVKLREPTSPHTSA